MNEINNDIKNNTTKNIEINGNKEKNNNVENSDIYNNILENQIQKLGFLTNMPSENIIEKKQKKEELKRLKEKQNELTKKINSVKNKKNEMNEISFNNISKAKVDSNLCTYNIKNMKSLEINLIDKLNEVKDQIKVLNNDIGQNKKKELKQLKLESIKFDETNIYQQLLKQNSMRLKEIEKNYKNKLMNYEEELNIINKKLKKEKELKMMNLKKFENIKLMEDINSPSNRNNFLYIKMEKDFLEKEKKLINNIIIQRKIKNIFYKQNIDEDEKEEYKNYKKNLVKKAQEQTNNMKKLWHSRSMMMKIYQSTKNNKIFQKEEINIKKEQIKDKNKDRIKYSKEKVKLPIINERLKEESEWRQIDIKNLKGKERVNFINKKYKQKGIKITSIAQYGKNALRKNKMNKNSRQSNLAFNIYSYEGIRRNNREKNIKLFQKNKSSDNIIMKKKENINPKEINYLNDLKETNKKQVHNWNGYIMKNKSGFDTDGIKIIQKKIENIDEKVKLNKELMNVKGGYINNTELGNKVNNMILDSIKGKLAILDGLYNNNINE
mgnify:CR=1 FL=1